MKEQGQAPGPGVSGSELAEIKARYEAAAEGPWTAKPTRIIGDPQVHDSIGKLVLTVRRGPEAEKGSMLAELSAAATAEFTAAARTDIPALVTALEEAQGKLDAVGKEILSAPPSPRIRRMTAILKGK